MRRIDLYEHNKEAYEKAEKMMQKEGKAAIIHPTGTGKSFIAFALIERHPEANFVWLAPSEYIYNLQMEKLWIKQHVRFKNVTFYTYNNLMWHEEVIEDLNPSYVILDEFHRAGAREWGKSTKKLLNRYPDAKVLGLSATNIRYLDKRRDMADEIFDGHIASEISVCEAMAQGILPEPKYVITVYSYDERLKHLERRVEVMQNGYCRAKSKKLIERLRRALEKAEGMGDIFKKHLPERQAKVIIFCTDSEHMFEMASKVPEWFYGVDARPHIYRVYSYNPESEEDFQKFKDDESDHLKLLFCIDMLNEGIHVDGVSAVVLCRPTISPIIYKQQVGRALAAGSAKNPVIFDLVNNFDSLSPIADLQNEYKKAKGHATRARVDNSDISGFEIIDELRDCRELMDEIRHNIETSWDVCYREYAKYVEENGTPRVPRRFITEDGLQLGKWLLRQKNKYRRGKLTEDEVNMLEQCGIDWEYESDENFMHWVELLRKYKEKYGDLRVQYTFVWEDDEPDEAPESESPAIVIRHEQRIKNNKLGQWCNLTRRLYREGKLLPERVKLLEDMGFTWENPDYFWEEGYRHARAYYEEHGDISCKTKYECEDGYKLGSWLNRQRKVREGKSRGIMTDEKIKALDELGMVWVNPPKPVKSNKEAFDVFLKAFVEFKKEQSDGLVPVKYETEDGIKLGTWVMRIRMAFNKGTLKEEQYIRLKEAGFPFYYYSTYWYKGYQKAKAYYEENGNLYVPRSYTEENGDSLYTWLGKQKAEYLKPDHGMLSELQVKLLEEINITKCRRMEDKYNCMIEALRQYIKGHGDNLVPLSYVTPEGDHLGKWLAHQRTKNRNGKLEEWRIKALNEAGMEWENYETVYARRYWDEMYEEAKKYAKEHGSIHDMSTSYVTGDGKKLGSWIAQMRGIKKGIRKHSIELDERRISMLDSLGMNWEPPLYSHHKNR